MDLRTISYETTVTRCLCEKLCNHNFVAISSEPLSLRVNIVINIYVAISMDLKQEEGDCHVRALTRNDTIKTSLQGRYSSRGSLDGIKKETKI